jgi:drug/metabolite transporter (DMT)-like permease
MVAIFLLGFLGFSIMGTTYYVALSVTPAWLIALFAALYPLTINGASWFFLNEPITRQQGLALVSVLLGGMLLFLQPFESTAWLGVILMCVNVTAVTIYILVGQHWTRGIPPVMSATWTVIGAALGTACYALFSGQVSFAFAPSGWLWIFCFGVVSTALAILTSWWGISLIGAARSSIIGSSEPLTAVLLAVLILGEHLTRAQIAGGALILIGMFVVQWQPKRRIVPSTVE